MLPSGNDAAICIGEAIGLLHYLKVKNKRVDPHKDKWYEQYLQGNKNYMPYFISLMNEKCQKMGVLESHFYNPHGNDAFDQFKNVSTCYEVAKISVEFVEKYETLKKVVNTKVY